MKTIILIFLALFLNSCAVYIIKYDCPQKDTVIIKENYPYWNFRPEPYYPEKIPTWILRDSIWILKDWSEPYYYYPETISMPYVPEYPHMIIDTIWILEDWRDIIKQQEFIWEDKMPIIEKIKELQDSLNQEFYRNFK